MNHTQLDTWLARWEEWQEQYPNKDVDDFVHRFLVGQPDDLIEQVRHAIAKLSSLERLLPGDTDLSVGNTSDRSESALVLRSGIEPIPGYKLEIVLGRGGFGEVWQACGPGKIHVALKFVRLDHPVAMSELRAIHSLRDLRHPHLVSLFGAWQKSGWLIIAMELAERSMEQELRKVMTRGLSGIPVAHLRQYMVEAAKGLDYLNGVVKDAAAPVRRGIQHRDVKPHNLLLVGGCVKVGDFGLARVLDEHGGSHSGSMTPDFAAPEFFSSQTFPQSDQYSLAVTYCYLRSGRLPFTGNRAAVMNGHLTGTPDLGMLSIGERPVVERALSKKPESRWRSCTEFVAALSDPVNVQMVTVINVPASSQSTETNHASPTAPATTASVNSSPGMRIKLKGPPMEHAVVALIFFICVGLVSTGFIPPGCAKNLPLVGKLYKDSCDACWGLGKNREPCRTCHGYGYLRGKTCPVCTGSGKLEKACIQCGGSGKIPTK